MAGDWIKMRSDLHTHPKVVRISSALKADRLRVVGGLHAVWCLFDMHSEDGMLSGYTTDTVDELIGFPGFARALCAVNWLAEEGDGLSMPEFDEHNGQSAKRRATETKRKRKEREEDEAESVRNLSASDADKKRSREEKRREEITTSLRSVVAAPRATRKCPESFEVTEDLQTWAAREAPRVDLARETAKFMDHTFKTARSDWPGTWRNWMRQAAEGGASRSGPNAVPHKYAAAAATIYDGVFDDANR